MWNFKSYYSLWILIAAVAATHPAVSAAAPIESTPVAQNPGGWHHVTVGVKSLDVALTQWIEMMGFEVRSQREGPDAGLATLWGIESEDIERQAIIGTPGADSGLIHLVQFRNPDRLVREGAEVFDLLPKNLDVFVKGLPERFTRLQSAGATFRTDTYSDVTTPSGGRFMEIHMHGHDATNIVLVETPGKDRDLYTDKGFTGVVQLITIVPDANAEEAFYTQGLGLTSLANNFLKGPEVEKMVGLPPGSGLDIRILGGESTAFGLMELVDYHGVEGSSRYHLARPKALGTLHVSYFLSDLSPLKQRLAQYGTKFIEHASTETLFGSGPSISFRTPAGLRIEAHLRPGSQ